MMEHHMLVDSTAVFGFWELQTVLARYYVLGCLICVLSILALSGLYMYSQ